MYLNFKTNVVVEYNIINSHGENFNFNLRNVYLLGKKYDDAPYLA
jgi:hypothetical protein